MNHECGGGALARLTKGIRSKLKSKPSPHPKPEGSRKSFLQTVRDFHLVPGSRSITLWEKCVVAVGCINGFIIPFSAAFNEVGPFTLALQYAIDAFYLLDMYIHFHTAYVERGFIVIFPREMAWNYMRSLEFKIDVFSNFPWDILALVAVGVPDWDPLSLLAIVRLVKLLRSIKLIWWFNKQEKRLSSSTGMQIVKFAVYISLAEHWLACLWYAIACPGTSCLERSWAERANFSASTILEQYIASLYWSVMSMTTTGYGDIHAVSDGEQVFSIIAMVSGVFLFGYVSGTIASILSNLDSRRVAYRQKVEAIRQYMSDQRMEKGIQKRVAEWFEYSWDRNRGIDVANVFNDLPTAFRAEVALTLNHEALNKIQIFKGTSLGFKRRLAFSMGVNYFTAGTCIVHKNEMSKEMYYIIQGRVDMLDDEENLPIYSLVEGSHFGEFSLILGLLSPATMVSVSNCDVYVISNATIHQARESYPEDFEIVQQNTEELNRNWQARPHIFGKRMETNPDACEEKAEQNVEPDCEQRANTMESTAPCNSLGSFGVRSGCLEATSDEMARLRESRERRRSSAASRSRPGYEAKLPQKLPERRPQ